MPPLKKRKPHELLKPECVSEKTEVFRVRVTGEVFTSYSDYIERVLMYQQRIWTCAISGKTNLTYEEALLSERMHSKKVEDIPELLVGSMARMIHMSTLRLDDLVERIHSKFNTEFMLGEQACIQSDVNNKQVLVPVVIVRAVHEDGETAEQVVGVEEEGEMQQEGSRVRAYEVELVGDRKEADGGEMVRKTKIEKIENILRQGKPLSRALLKNKLKEIATRDTYIGAPWMVNEDLVAKFNLPNDLPPHLRRLKLVSDYRQGKIDLSEAVDENGRPLMKRSKLSKQLQDPAAREAMMRMRKAWEGRYTGKELCASQIAHELWKVIDDCEHRQQLVDNYPMDDRQNIEFAQKTLFDLLSAWNDPETPLINQPIEDTLLPIDPYLPPKPKPLHSSLTLDATLLPQLIHIWCFVQRYSFIIRLSPFSLDDLESAITHNEVCSLVKDLHIQLLRCCFQEYEISPPAYDDFPDQNTDSELFDLRLCRSAHVTTDNWIFCFAAILTIMPCKHSVPRPSIKKLLHEGYHGLCVEEKVSALDFLVSECLEVEAIRLLLDKTVTYISNIIKEQRVEEANKKKFERELKEKEKEKDQQKDKPSNDGHEVDDVENPLDNDADDDDTMNGHTEGNAGMHHGISLYGSVDANHTPNSSRPETPTLSDEDRRPKAPKWHDDGNGPSSNCASGVESSGGRGTGRLQTAAIRAAEREKERLRKLEQRKIDEEKARFDKKQALYEKELERHVLREEPLGQDRNYNTFWFFFGRDSRIFMQGLQEDGKEVMLVYHTKEELDALVASLDVRGRRERHLEQSLTRQYWRIVTALRKRDQEKKKEHEDDVRRSGRHAASKHVELPTFLTYQNKLA